MDTAHLFTKKFSQTHTIAECYSPAVESPAVQIWVPEWE
nr:MAG TPA: hypothetical protein [Caudoviricetes sp.]